MAVADAVVTAWEQIDVVLTPILGQRGVAALYQRSLHLTRSAHSWLPGLEQDGYVAMNLTPLKAELMLQDSAATAAAGGALLQTFHALLASLVGPALTERLLLSVWEHLLDGRPPQEDPS
ncbi:MAG: hypothetical protein LH491_07490 [Pseudoxanthomonas sp.]|nr:hypothetical protein [Pseudoxanthomonas sp.]